MPDYKAWGTRELIMELVKKDRQIQEATRQLRGLLSWSDRIGSDEIGEINEIIKTLKK